jgi:hypothetical protein
MIELALWIVVSELAIIIFLLIQVNVSNPISVDWIKIIFEFVRVVGPLLFIGFSIYFFYILFLKI